VSGLGTRLAAAEASGATLMLPPEEAPADLTAAEALQGEFVAARGKPAGAWKLGATTAPVRARFALPRLFIGHIAAERVLASGTSLPASALRQRVIELEVAFRLGAALAPKAGGHAPEAVRDALEGVCAAFELPQSRFATLGEYGGLALIADNGAAGYAVAGPVTPAWSAEGLAKAAVRLASDTGATEAGSAEVILGGPFGSLMEFVALASEQGLTIPAGAYILTGACTALVDAATPAKLTGTINGVGTVELSLT